MHPLVCAARDGMMSDVQTLLDKEHDIAQSDKDNALMAACDGNYAGIVRILIAHGANKYDYCAMYLAVGKKSVDAVRALLESGYDLHSGNSAGLYAMAKATSPEMLNLLTENGLKSTVADVMMYSEDKPEGERFTFTETLCT